MGNCLSVDKYAPEKADKADNPLPLTELIKSPVPDDSKNAVSQETPPAKAPPEKEETPQEPVPIQEDVDPTASAKGLPHRVGDLGPPVPPCETDRLGTIRALAPSLSLEAPPDPEVESILKLCQSIFQCPNTLVALFDDKRVFIREATGAFSRGDFPWRYSFCGWTMASSCHQVMVVPNALEDSRFENNKFVKELGVRFYCGTPLVSSQGHRLGTLCFADFKPRNNFDACQSMILNNLAEMVVRQIEKDMLLQARKHANEEADKMCMQLKRAADCVEDCVVLVDVSQPGWRILYVNAAWDNMMGCSRGCVANTLVQDTLQLCLSSQEGGAKKQALPLPQPGHEAAVKAGKELVIQGVGLVNSGSALSSGSFAEHSGAHTSSSITEQGGRQQVVLTLRPAAKGAFKSGGLPVGVPSFVPGRFEGADRPSTEHLYFMFVEPVQVQRAKLAKMSSAISWRSSKTFHLDKHDPDSGMLWDSAGADSWSKSTKGLEMGALLGSGSFGTVYSAALFGTKVAVKIIEEDIKVEDGQSVEAFLGVELRHPHVVSVLKVMVRRLTSSPSSLCSSQPSVVNAREKPQNLELDAARTRQLQQEQQELQEEERQQWEQLRQQQEAVLQGDTGKDEEVAGNSEVVNAWPLLEQPMGSEGPKGVNPNASESASAAFERRASTLVPCQTWLVMEFCDKGCLQDAVDRGWLRTGHPNGQPKMPAIIATAYEVASALMYLHSKGIVHGDLSPFNVLLTTTGPRAPEGGRGFVAKASDFGLARALNIASRITTKTYGTLTHQPPETLAEGVISRATDIYSLGVLLWAMYTGSRPWAGLSHAQIVGNVAGRREHLRMPPSTPASHAPFASLTMRCLSYDVGQRPGIEEVLAALESMQQGPLYTAAAA